MALPEMSPQLAFSILSEEKGGARGIHADRPDLRRIPVSPAKICQSPENEQDLRESGQVSFGKSSGLRKKPSHPGDSLKMSQGFFLLMADATCGLSSTGYESAGLLSATGFSTVSISESPKDGAVCFLSAVLQSQVSSKYFLSPKAAAGILRRAEKRGRTLPDTLQQKLTALAMTEEAKSLS